MEQRIGFWSAYLLCFCMFIVGIAILLAGKKSYILRPPRGSVIPHAFRAMWIGLKNKGNMGKLAFPSAMKVMSDTDAFIEAAKPSYQEEYGRKDKTPWNDLFIDEIKRALIACRVFLFFPIYWVVYSQMLNNFISQGTPRLYPSIIQKRMILTSRSWCDGTSRHS